ncbi:hypothetical protein [Streptomyces sp. KLOTTS4A1]|uniref:hypothetical protein n=1 Tax=Streptomyces sp. KLOTTS4A1 TaxID=3390996 RepID=UPI0039F62F8F
MRKRHTMKARRALTAVAITTGLVFTVAGCGGDGGNDDPPKDSKSSSPATKDEKGGKGQESKEPEDSADAEVLAEVTGGQGITLTVTSAKRDQGGFLTVTGKVTNGGQGNWVARGWQGPETELRRNSSSMAGASLVDQSGKKKYLILRDTEGQCLCTRFQSGLKNGESADWYAQFPAPPASTTEVDFQIADMPPATIEISEGE